MKTQTEFDDEIIKAIKLIVDDMKNQNDINNLFNEKLDGLEEKINYLMQIDYLKNRTNE